MSRVPPAPMPQIPGSVPSLRAETDFTETTTPAPRPHDRSREEPPAQPGGSWVARRLPSSNAASGAVCVARYPGQIAQPSVMRTPVASASKAKGRVEGDGRGDLPGLFRGRGRPSG